MTETNSVFERHAQTIISAIVLALLAWTGTTLLDVRERLTRIEAIKIAEAGNDQRVHAELQASDQRTSIELTSIRDRLREVELRLEKGGRK